MDSYNFDNYKIERLIGEGSFGRVYKAEDRDSKKFVALKVLAKVRMNFYYLFLKIAKMVLFLPAALKMIF